MAIGAFARLCRLTPKAVRHYEAEGLLTPARVDPHSGYRYYTAEQVPTAATIALLRGLDVPLPVVRAVLAAPGPEAVAAVLAAQRQRWAAELERREQVLRGLDTVLRDPAAVRYDVAVAERGPSHVAGLTETVAAPDLDRATGDLCRRLVASGIGRAPLVGVFPLDLDETVRITVGVPGVDGTALPGGEWASTLHVGPYPGLPGAYAALLGRVADLDRVARGPVTETYLADPATTSPAELVTRVAVALG